MGFTVKRGSEKGSQKGFFEWGFQKMRLASLGKYDPLGVRPITADCWATWWCDPDCLVQPQNSWIPPKMTGEGASSLCRSKGLESRKFLLLYEQPQTCTCATLRLPLEQETSSWTLGPSSEKTTIRTEMITNENLEILFRFRFRNGKPNKLPQIFFRICFRNDHVGHTRATTEGHAYETN